MTDLGRVWREEAQCENSSTYHCNRDKETWYPGRRTYQRELLRQNKTKIVDLQEVIKESL